MFWECNVHMAETLARSRAIYAAQLNAELRSSGMSVSEHKSQDNKTVYLDFTFRLGQEWKTLQVAYYGARFCNNNGLFLKLFDTKSGKEEISLKHNGHDHSSFSTLRQTGPEKADLIKAAYRAVTGDDLQVENSPDGIMPHLSMNFLAILLSLTSF